MNAVTHDEPIKTLPALLSILQTFDRPLASDELNDLVARIELPRSAWEDDVRFQPDEFCFHTLYDSPHFELNLIGWRCGQVSCAHDHRGSACCVRVLAGVLTNRDYQLSPAGQLLETGRRDLHPGELLARQDHGIHRCGNEQADGRDLVTLHLYSPPLRPREERRYD